ncbi:AzlC family ABC transporter permease [Actinomycetospora endophytica]|uniref:AzlC family ABC transporter permease n=1 Tax=Actinomycetospora endophytica TaxID=2291215 RepID=A0ABS8PAV0_9PSEU|nr:AzlC family ABC transporter permease [Actinomycetospora endophytica]MCD2195376.1 AzlC family ABC transporter permease [Actinomycetospora endophytica]
MSTAERTQAVVAPVVRHGCRDAAAVVLAYVPFGVTLGATLARTGVNPLTAWASSPLMFGGAAQLLSVQLLDAGANAIVVILGALVVNARMLLYSASLAPHAGDWPARWRWAGAYLLADPVYAVAVARFSRPDRGGDGRVRLTYYLAVGLTFWVGWMGLTGAGALLAGVLPASLSLELAAPLTFLLLLLPMLADRAAYAAAAVGGGVAVLASGLPLGLGLLLGAAAGVTAGGLIGARHA